MNRLLSKALHGPVSLGYNARPSGLRLLNLAKIQRSGVRALSTANDATETPTTDNTPGKMPPKATGAPETLEFKAETRRLLNLVGSALYSEQEIFVRELVSNASDALKRRRHLELTQPDSVEADDGRERAIWVTADKNAKTIVVEDSGVGMTRDELVEHLGVIAASGSSRFKTADETGKAGQAIIGQFGVGFYSSFMVADHVTVYTRSALAGSPGWCWTSDGKGSFAIREATDVPIGTRIEMSLKDAAAREFCEPLRLQTIVQTYNNFAEFPIRVNDEHVNTVAPLWTRTPSAVTDEEHTAFYRLVAKAWDAPRFRLHFCADAPLSVQALLYVPETHSEQQGLRRLEPGVAIYSRRVMIQPRSKAILPEWLRFVRGVVESEDIPLNISRELLQNGALISRLRQVLTQRVVRWFADEARRDPKAYAEFYRAFGSFIKEGVCSTDAGDLRDALVPLLRFDSSAEGQEYVSIADYAASLPEAAGKDRLYYLPTSSPAAARVSPYLDVFREAGVPVLLSYDPIDEFVFNTLGSVGGRRLVNVENAEKADLEPVLAHVEALRASSSGQTRWSPSDAEKEALCVWLKDTLGDSGLNAVRATARPASRIPALVTAHMSGTMRRLLSMQPGFRESQAMARDSSADASPTAAAAATAPGGWTLELNFDSPIVERLFQLHQRDAGSAEARAVARQLYDNACLAASLIDDPRVLAGRLQDFLDQFSRLAVSLGGEASAASESVGVSDS